MSSSLWYPEIPCFGKYTMVLNCKNPKLISFFGNHERNRVAFSQRPNVKGAIRHSEMEYDPPSKKTKHSHGLESSKFVIENDVGIEEFLYQDDCQPIFAVFKQRFADFIVREIDTENEIVSLTSYDIPPRVKRISKNLYAFPPDALAILNSIDKNSKETVVMEAPPDKDLRKIIHDSIKEQFPHLESKTILEEETRKISAIVRNTNAVNYRNWTSEFGGTFCNFTLYKEGMDTMHALSLISTWLHVNTDRFTYAGSKDKQASTTQKVSAYKVDAAHLLELNKRLIGVRLGNFSYVNKRIGLGDLKGNSFTIVLRNLSNRSLMEVRLKFVKAKGFINYFGLQRFGTTSIPTHLIGIAMLQNDWREVVNLIMKPREGESDEQTKIRNIWFQEHDHESALSNWPSHGGIEFVLLKGLVKFGLQDCLSAFSLLPRNTRILYLHSFQSYIWNMAASERIRIHGLKVIEGDLVIDSSTSAAINVTSANVNDFSIQDVVLPMPGYDVVYPENMKDFYKQLLKKANVNEEAFNHKIKAYKLKGVYRNLLCSPANMQWEFVNYESPTQALVETDLARMENSFPEVEFTGSRLALILTVHLSSSSYATMLLRELTRVDTSRGMQILLND